MEPTIGLAFLAGLLSFISPCVLPLVPAYVGYMGGRLTHTVAAQTTGGGTLAASVQSRFVIQLHALAFVAGFTFIFVALGLLTTAFVVQIGRQNLSLIETVIARAGGVVVIFFGLHFMGAIRWLFNRLVAAPGVIGSPLLATVFALGGTTLMAWALVDILLVLPLTALLLLWLILGGGFTQPTAFWTRFIDQVNLALYSDTRQQLTATGRQDFVSSAVMGVVFAAGWTPCIGPVYGAVLTMAANGGDVGQAGTLLTAYSLGLGIPFLLTAALLDNVQPILRRIQRQMHVVELVTGVLLVGIGVLIATEQLQRLSNTFAAQFTDLSVKVETCFIGLAQGEIPFSDLGGCLAADPFGAETALNTPPMATALAPTNAPKADDSAVKPNGILSLAQQGDAVYGIEPGNLAPNFAVRDVSGGEQMLADRRGEAVILNFWATWCGPCRTEMPAFEAAEAAYADEIAVIAVNNRETVEEIARFTAEVPVTFALALDPDGAIQRLYGVDQYPTTLVIDRRGVITERIVGPMTEAQIERVVKDALG